MPPIFWHFFFIPHIYTASWTPLTFCQLQNTTPSDFFRAPRANTGETTDLTVSCQFWNLTVMPWKKKLLERNHVDLSQKIGKLPPKIINSKKGKTPPPPKKKHIHFRATPIFWNHPSMHLLGASIPFLHCVHILFETPQCTYPCRYQGHTYHPINGVSWFP